ncbi:MAG: Ig-like domain-containing protein, partial [Chromatiales bacterium]|nr:Ig-like domain-containing protein [Chromatiales bacterium]
MRSLVTALFAGMLLQNTLYAGTLTISSGATLDGAGGVNGGATVIASGATMSPGASPGCFGVDDFELASGSTLDIELDGTTACSGYDQVQVTGGVTLGGATLSLSTSNSLTPSPLDSFTLIDNDGVDAVSGTFSGLGEGDAINFSGVDLTISYVGGDGNDVVLTAKSDQAITFNALADKTFGDADFTLSASANSGLSVSFTSNTTSVCTVSGSTVSLVAAGSCSITASQVGDSQYYAATDVTQSFTVNKATPVISWSSPSSIIYGTPLSGTELDASTGVAGSFSYSPASGVVLDAGTQTLSVDFIPTDTANYNSVLGQTVSLTVNNAAPTLTMDSSAGSIAGESFTATFNFAQNDGGSGVAPGGNVTITASKADESDVSCSAAVAATGVCSLTLDVAGTWTLTATFAAENNYDAATSTGVSHEVTAITTTTAVTVVNPDGESNGTNSASAIYGQAVDVSVTVTPGSGSSYPPGTVDVSVDGKSCQIALTDQGSTVAGGSCTLDAGSGFPGLGTDHAVSAVYTPGSSSFSASSSSGAGNGSLTVTAADTTTVLSTTPTSSTAGESVDLVATMTSVSPGSATPTGTVAFSAEGNGISGCDAVMVDGSGSAICNTSFATSGTQTLSASFTGDAEFNSSGSGDQSHTVNAAESTTSIEWIDPAPGPYTYGDTLTLGVLIESDIDTPTGSVTVAAGAASCTITLIDGEGSCGLVPPAGDLVSITATYNGDATYGGSSDSAQMDIAQVTPTVTLTPTPSPSAAGDGVTFEVTVDRPNTLSEYATGTVTVKEGSNALCTTGNLVDGQASCVASFAATGNYSLTAEYTGDTNYQAASGSASHEVQAAATTTAITAITPNPADLGDSVTVDVSVTGNATVGPPTGTVSIAIGDGCTASLSVSDAAESIGSCSLTGLDIGVDQTVTATYSGSDDYGSSSTTDTLTVRQTQAITFGALADKTYGDADFTVSASADSGLTVSFASTTTEVCTVSGTTVSLVGAGSCSITASQSGDSSYNAAPDVVQSFTVNQADQTITFDALADKSEDDAAFAVSASADSGLAVSFASTTSGVCTVSGTTVSLVAVGTCSITASQAGDSNYNAAADVVQTFAVVEGDPDNDGIPDEWDSQPGSQETNIC